MRLLVEKAGPEYVIGGGSDSVPLHLINYLKYKVDEIDLLGGFSKWTEDHLPEHGYTYTEVNKNKTEIFRDKEVLKNRLFSRNPDVIHSHTPGYELNRYNKELGKPYIYTEHSISWIYEDDYLFDDADLITTVTHYSAEKIVKKNPKKYGKKTLVVPNSTHFVDYRDDPKITNLSENLRRHYAPNNEKIVLTIARLQEDKGVFELAEAITQLIEEGENIKFVYAGIVPDEESKERLLNIFRSKNMEDRIVFNGKIPEGNEEYMAALYKCADVFALPSDGTFESFSVALLEALSMETPSIIGYQGGPKEVFVDQGLAVGVTPRDVEAIKKGIRYIFENYEEEMERARIASRIIEKRYHTNLIAEIWAKIYEKLITDKRIILEMCPFKDVDRWLAE